LAALEATKPPPSKAVIRQAVRNAVLEKAITRKEDVMALQHFFSTVAICAEDGTCDPDTASRYFGDLMLGFVNSYCVFFEYRRDTWNSSQALDAEIVAFLRKYYLRDKPLPKGREDWFICEGHRRTARNKTCFLTNMFEDFF
jgi:hypothetical protein